jgi:small subunit ribosomal protein S18
MARKAKVQKKRKPPETKGRVRRGRPKVCIFCAEHVEWVDYKDVALLRRFINDRGRIKARGATGTCSQHQRDVALAVKTARELVLLPYVVRTFAVDKGDRRGGPRRGRPAERTPTSDAETSSDTSSADSTSANDVVAAAAN